MTPPGPIVEAPPATPRVVPRTSRRVLRAKQRSRRRRRLAWLALVVSGAVAVNLAGVGPSVVRDGLDGLVPGSSPARPVELASILVAVPTDDGVVTALFGPVDGGGAVLLMPGATQVEAPSLGSVTLSDAYRAGGEGALRLAVENALGVRVTTVALLDEAARARLFGAAAPFTVRLRRPVEDAGWSEGEHRVDGHEASALLASAAESGFDGLVTAHAVLEGWFAALSRDDLAAIGPLLSSRPEVRNLLEAMEAGKVRFDALEVESVALPEGERYAPGAAAEEEARRLFPSLALAAPGAARPRVEVLNGTGEPGLAARVAERVVPEGFQIVLSGNAKHFGQRETVVVVHGDASAARRLVDVLGVGVLRAAPRPVSVVDVSIVVGHDFEPGGG